MSNEDKLRGKREKQQDHKKSLQDRLHTLQREELELTRKIIKAKKNAKTRKTESTREKAADHVDVLVGQRKHVRAEIQEALADLGHLNARLHRLANKIKVATQKRLAKQRYYASEHFRIDEFDCNDGTPVPKSAYDALRHLCETYLEPLRSQYGSVNINSGYRTRSYNASIGGASISVHIYDEKPNAVAADHTTSQAGPSTVASFHEGKGAGGVGRYATFTHVDNRQRIGWPTARWSG